MLQVSWSRQIQLLVGNTNQSHSTVLASYFVGLGIGAIVAGRLVHRTQPLVAYAIAEGIVAVWCFCMPLALRLIDDQFEGWFLAFGCLLALLPATIALGTTFPFAVAFLSDSKADSSRASRVYGWNTLGAVVGVITTSTLLLVAVGVTRTGVLAATISAVCSMVGLLVSRQTGWQTLPATESTQSAKAANTSPAGADRKVRLALAAFSGFVILGLEVLYLKLFGLVFHNSTHTFGIVLAVFLLALVCGAWMQPGICRRYSNRLVPGSCLAIGSLLVLVSVCIFVRFTGLRYFEVGGGFVAYLISAFGLVALVVFPPVSVLGVVLPSVWSSSGLAAEFESQAVAETVAGNSFAGAIGAVAASFLLLPIFGLWTSFVVIAVFAIAVSSVLLFGTQYKAIVLLCGPAALLLGVLMSVEPGAERWAVNGDEELVRRWNSSYGFIDVVCQKSSGVMKVRQNLHYRHGSTGKSAQRIQRMGHIPLLLHPNPQHTAFLGLGTGLTAGAALAHKQIRSVEIVELIPEVVSAAKLLSEWNFGIVDDRRTTIHIDDARHFLRSSNQKFDVIVADLFVPWESATGYLYSVQHFQNARRRLKTNGIYCQWIPLYQLGPVEFEMIADSFDLVFPCTSVWWGNLHSERAVIALVGSESALQIDSDDIDRRIYQLQKMGKYDDGVIRSSADLHFRLAGGWEGSEQSVLNTDEHPWVEFLMPASHQNRTLLQGEALADYFTRVLRVLPLGDVQFHLGDRPFVSEDSRRGEHEFLLRR